MGTQQPDFLFCTYLVLYILYMMTSVGGDRSRGTRDKTQVSATQTQPQKQQVQATAEQIRLAQMIYDKNDAEFENKVKQLMEVTGKNQDESIVALHDCNGDVNRAINILLEGNSDTTSWETVGKKKSLGKDSSENKENREKRGDREVSRGRGISNRRGRGGSRGREFRLEENGVDVYPGDRSSDRGRRGRGRVTGGRGRGRGGGGRFSAQGMGTFNPADYTDSVGTDGVGTKPDVWESSQNDTDDGTGAWRNSMEEWTAEDWNEDLSETKVFTASSALPSDHQVVAGQSIDLVALLQKPVPGSPSEEHLQQQSFSQALVFTNSQHGSQMTALAPGSSVAANSYSHPSLSSVLGSGFGELGSPKMMNSPGSPIVDHLKSCRLGQLSTQSPSQSGGGGTSSWDVKPPASQTAVLSQFNFKSQPEPSPVLSQLTQRQQQQQAQAAHVPPPGLGEPFSSQVKLRESSPIESAVAASKILQLASVSLDSQLASVAQQTQQKQVKPLKRKMPPLSKIPSSAVEMPGSADMTGLNVQFGALEFGSEPSLPEFGSTASPETVSLAQNTLYPKSVSESLSTSVSMAGTAQEGTYASPVVSTTSLSTSPQNTPTTTSPSYDPSSVHSSRIPYQSSMAPSPQKDTAPVTNGYNGVRTQPTLEASSSVSTSKSDSLPSLPNMGPSLPSTVSTASSHLPTVSQHSVALSNLSQTNDPPSGPHSQLSSSLPNHQSSNLTSSSALSSSTSHTQAIVDSCSATTSLPAQTTYSTTVSAAAASPAAAAATTTVTAATTSTPVVSVASSLSTTNTLGLSPANVPMPSSTTRAAPLVSSGKAPPNLPQGVPPLLPNQYIVGPGGLLTAYPQIYGFDDLQMLQSRLPMDYYGITFPAPTAALAGRDGSLASNPYSGDVTKFGRGDSASPAPATTLAQPQQNQTQTHHTTQQPFLNPTLPPGYNYAGLPYYAGMPGVPSAFQYGPTMFVPPASAKQHGVNVNTASTPFQQANSYGQHGYGTGYDELTQAAGAGDYSKGGYAGSSQAQNKSTGPGKGVSVTSSNSGVPDISGSVYKTTQPFDKQGFPAGTPPPFNLPSALGSTGPLNPGTAPGYAPAPFLHILPPPPQPHSQLLHHHLPQDGQGASGQRSQQSSMQQKSQANKPTYGTSAYWTS
ncbi:ubiquitin-associated protein 2a isoform X3 [Latimeria chalumnae]|uniref:ubiquitin-associated protein 2a isoform X3 n=1 Tax=Latimeria chalumnae TaxID=7897 RepID=UPI00313D468A